MEEALWSAPSSSTESPQVHLASILGSKSASTPGGGFTGGDPSGFSNGAAGIKVLMWQLEELVIQL